MSDPDKPITIILPCNCDSIVYHRKGERRVHCYIHNTSYLVKVIEQREINYQITDESST